MFARLLLCVEGGWLRDSKSMMACYESVKRVSCFWGLRLLRFIAYSLSLAFYALQKRSVDLLNAISVMATF